MKKVLVTSRSFGKIGHEPLETLTNGECEYVLHGANFDQAAFDAELKDYDALIIGAHPLTAEVLAQCPNLKIICKHGAGVDNIPFEQCRKQGVKVCNVLNTNSNAVADLAFGFMLDLARKIIPADRNVHNGLWKTETGVDVYGKTLGLYGFGAISKCVARRAKGFSMKVLAYDAFIHEVPDEFKDYVTLVSLDEMVSRCDFMSVHLPLNEETHHIVNKSVIEKMKPGAFLINTCRGGVVSEADLYEALVSGRLAGAAMDVSEEEPMNPQNPLLTLDNVIVTAHIGMYSREAMGAVSQICADNIVAFFRGEPLRFEIL